MNEELIIELQNQLFDISERTVAAVSDFILQNEICDIDCTVFIRALHAASSLRRDVTFLAEVVRTVTDGLSSESQMNFRARILDSFTVECDYAKPYVPDYTCIEPRLLLMRILIDADYWSDEALCVSFARVVEVWKPPFLFMNFVFCLFAWTCDKVSHLPYKWSSLFQRLPKAEKLFKDQVASDRESGWQNLRNSISREFVDDKWLCVLACDGIEELTQESRCSSFNPNLKIAKDIRNIYFRHFAGECLITAAAGLGAVKCFKYLWLNGADRVDSLTKFAVIGGNLEIIRILHQEGFSFVDAAKFAVMFHRNVLFDWLDMQQLIAADELAVCMVAAAQANNVRMLRVMIDKGGPLNGVKSKKGTISALHAAAQCGSIDCLKLLLEEKDIEVNDCDHSGMTPLNVAARYGQIEAMRILLDHGSVDPNIPDCSISTPLHYLAEQGNLEGCVLMRSNAATKCAPKSLRGLTPRHNAIHSGNRAVVAFFDEWYKSLGNSLFDEVEPSYF